MSPKRDYTKEGPDHNKISVFDLDYCILAGLRSMNREG